MMTATISPLLLWCQSDRPFEFRVFSLVNHAHAAFAELGGDLVVGDDLADHRQGDWYRYRIPGGNKPSR